MILLFFRSRLLPALVASIVLVAGLCMIVPADLSQNPVNSEVSVLLAGFPALAGATFWAALVSSPMPELEATGMRSRVSVLRGAWLLAGTIGLSAAGALAFSLRGLDGWFTLLHLRNLALGVGIATLGGILLPKAASWLPIAAYAGACWLAGTTDVIATASAWAIPCYPADSIVGAAASSLIWASTSLLYAGHSPAIRHG